MIRRLHQPESRRAALGALLSGLLLPQDAAAQGKQARRGKRQGNARDRKDRAAAQAECCWRAGKCIPSKGSNVGQCDLGGSTAFQGLNCTGCNVSRANLNGVNARGANFTRANLSGSCLIDADFTGAIFASNTNLYNATFCHTIMPDGSVNNSGCASAPACCAACRQTGEFCGPAVAGPCCGTDQCVDGACKACATCESLGKDCGSWPDGCGNIIECGAACTICQANCPSTCRGCISLADGSLACRNEGYTNCVSCTSNAECADGSEFNTCYTGFTRRGGATTFTAAANCEDPTMTGACADLSEFLCEPGSPDPMVERAMPARGDGRKLLSP